MGIREFYPYSDQSAPLNGISTVFGGRDGRTSIGPRYGTGQDLPPLVMEGLCALSLKDVESEGMVPVCPGVNIHPCGACRSASPRDATARPRSRRREIMSDFRPQPRESVMATRGCASGISVPTCGPCQDFSVTRAGGQAIAGSHL